MFIYQVSILNYEEHLWAYYALETNTPSLAIYFRRPPSLWINHLQKMHECPHLGKSFDIKHKCNFIYVYLSKNERDLNVRVVWWHYHSCWSYHRPMSLVLRVAIFQSNTKSRPFIDLPRFFDIYRHTWPVIKKPLITQKKTYIHKRSVTFIGISDTDLLLFE